MAHGPCFAERISWIVASLSALLLAGSAPAETLATRSFSLANDPSAVVLHLSEQFEELASPGPTLTLYADGRLVVEYPPVMKRAGTYERRLAASELNATLASLLDKGLGEFDARVARARKEQAARARMRARAVDPSAPGLPVYESDATTTRIELKLAAYAVDPAAARPLDRTIVWSGLRTDGRDFPEVPELVALADAVALLRQMMNSPELAKVR